MGLKLVQSSEEIKRDVYDRAKRRALDAAGDEVVQLIYAPRLEPVALGFVQRGIDKHGIELEAIISAGWALRHWAVAADGAAHPVFTR